MSLVCPARAGKGGPPPKEEAPPSPWEGSSLVIYMFCASLGLQSLVIYTLCPSLATRSLVIYMLCAFLAKSRGKAEAKSEGGDGKG